MFVWFKEPTFNFTGSGRIFLVLSALACLAGLYAGWRLARGEANLGTDFGGGALLHLSAAKPVEVEAVRSALRKRGFEKAGLQRMRETGDNRDRLLVRLPLDEGTGVGLAAERVLPALAEAFPDHGWRLEGSDEVGPSVSAKLRRDAFRAFLLAGLGILAYIAFRFDLKFGLAAVVTTVHDVLVLLAVVVLSGMEFNLLAVTALLTLAGYSLNDTVVIFDRIRENGRLLVRESYASVVNRSLNETLNRTLNTSGTTLLVVACLWALGGETLRGFSFILLLGILVGTYSSIWVACPLLVEWNRKRAP